MRARFAILLTAAHLAFAVLPACESFVEDEGPGSSSSSADEADDALAQKDLDDALCWQEIGSDPGDTSEKVQMLHDECMRGKGWTVDE